MRGNAGQCGAIEGEAGQGQAKRPKGASARDGRGHPPKCGWVPRDAFGVLEDGTPAQPGPRPEERFALSRTRAAPKKIKK